jgi:hypothetical protein
MQAGDSDSEPGFWPKPGPEDLPEVHEAWKSRPKPLSNESPEMQRAWDQMLLEDYRREAKKRKEREAKTISEAAERMYYIISSFANI